MFSRRMATLHAGWRLGLFILLLALLGLLTASLFYVFHFPPQLRHGVLQPFPLLVSAVTVASLILGATVLCLRYLEGRPVATVGLPTNPLPYPGIIAGLGLGAIVPICTAGTLWMIGYASIERCRLSSADLLHATLPMVGSTLLLATWEEMAFRGYPLQLLSEIGGPWLATSLTGLLFGLAHSGNPGASPLGFANTVLNGVLLAWVVIQSGSLWLACGYHAGWNLAATNLLGLRDSGVIAPGSLLTTALTGPAWLSGSAYGFEASVLTGLTEAITLTTVLALTARLPSVPIAQPYFAGQRPRPPTAAT
jgi:hypothetical protein